MVAGAAAAMLIAPATASASFPHLVEPGESLSSVAASDGLTVEQLAAANGLSPEASLVAGSTLMIPSQTAEAGEAGSGASETRSSAEGSERSAPAAGSYVVQPGDTLSAIAANAGVSTAELASANGIDEEAPLLAGAVLTVPVASASAAASQSSGASADQSANSSPEAAAEGASNAPPYPTEETVTPSEVGSIAAEHGVPPSLAEAIASQESGFNNSVRSSADARGVMQILPETWSFISQELAGSTPLSAASAASNVRGGVLLLRSLLDATGGDPALAAAAYYQGLESVRQEGVAPETEEYVSSVLALQQHFGGE
jgi:soluble lytic murein transglycosylase-like protein